MQKFALSFSENWTTVVVVVVSKDSAMEGVNGARI